MIGGSVFLAVPQ